MGEVINNSDAKVIQKIGDLLNDPKRPMKERFRALFTLRSIGGPVAIQCISDCFNDDSVLLKHELAYCLGQMQEEDAIPLLINVLRDESQEVMVRHEAGEALGALGNPEVLSVLEEFINDPLIDVAETCQLAQKRVQWVRDKKCDEEKNLTKNPYSSVDPAPPATGNDVHNLQKILLDDDRPLFERYRAMFALRNIGSKECILSISKGLKHGSALFRHEIAFVLGQLQDPISVPFLCESLEDKTECEMVRHECAEALGSIATEDCMQVLEKYLSDDKRVVRESCEVALDMCEYENSPEFQTELFIQNNTLSDK